MKIIIKLLSIMIIAGIIGGLSNLYITENFIKEEISKKKILGYLITSLTASFLVPLFLNTLESSLVNTIVTNTENANTNEMLIFFGFCLLASISSNKFIQSLSNKILQSTQEKINKVERNTDQKLDEAQKEIEKLKNELKLANLEMQNTEGQLRFQRLDINRQTKTLDSLKATINEQDISNNLILARFILESGDLEDAKNNYEEILEKSPNNIKAQIGKAVTLKRIGVHDKQEKYVRESLKIIDNIIDHNLKQDYPEYKVLLARCLYNKACFSIALSELTNKIIDEEKIKKYLLGCFEINKSFVKYALKDKDFNLVAELDWFKKICDFYL